MTAVRYYSNNDIATKKTKTMGFKLILFNLDPNGLVLSFSDEHFYQAAELEIRPLSWVKIRALWFLRNSPGAPLTDTNTVGNHVPHSCLSWRLNLSSNMHAFVKYRHRPHSDTLSYMNVIRNLFFFPSRKPTYGTCPINQGIVVIQE